MSPPASTSPVTHLRRAFGWNLGQVVPSQQEAERLSAAGQTDAVAQRYAVWRRSVLLVAAVVTAIAFALAVADTLDSGFGEFTSVGVAFEIVWLATAAALPFAALVGAARWTRPGAAAMPLAVAWAVAFLLPFVYALLPVGLLYHVQPITPASLGKLPTLDAVPNLIADPATVEKAIAIEEMVVEFVLAGSSYLLLLPAVLSLIPGVLNGCLRIKSLLPAAQLPGWLLVTIAPAFLLFWLVILVLVNHAVRSPLLVFGVLLWAGAPVLYTVFGRVFVQPHLTDADAARIVHVKRLIGVTTLAGLALMAACVLTAKVAGLKVIGFDHDTAVSTKLDELAEDDNLSLEDVQTALAESTSLVYAFDLSSYRLIIDVLAKLFIVTIVFSDLVLRATLTAWRNERTLREAGETGLDGAAAALFGG